MDDVIYSFLNVEYRCLPSHPPLRPHIELTIKETPMFTTINDTTIFNCFRWVFTPKETSFVFSKCRLYRSILCFQHSFTWSVPWPGDSQVRWMLLKFIPLGKYERSSSLFFVFSKYFFNLATKHFYGVISIFTVRNEVAKVMFFTGVCLSTGGVCLSACWDTTPYQEQTPPQSRHPQEQTPPRSRHPPGTDTPRSRHPPEQTPPPRDTVTAADGTHPTGMHSCFKLFWIFLKHFLFFLISEGSISWSFGLAILACVLFFLSIIFIVLSRSRESRMRENRKSYKRNTRPMSRPDEELKSGSFYDGASMQGSRPSSVYSIGQYSNRGYAAWIFVDIKMCVLGNWQDVVRKVSQESMGNLTHSKLQFLLMLQ